MTSEDWKQVEKDLKIVDLYTVKLLIDGYEVSLQLRQI